MTWRVFAQLMIGLAWLGSGLAAGAADPLSTNLPPENVADTRAFSTAPVLRSYVIKPSDEVKLDVYGEPDLSVTSVVDENNLAKFPLIDAIPVGGRTVEQATRLIHQALAKDYLVDPKVRLDVTRHAKRSFNIMGFVKSPGSYEIQGGESISLVQALSMAGGATADGNLNKIAVMRPAADGQPMRVWRKLNAVEMMRNEKAETFLIFPGDTIQVPDKLF